MDISDTVQKIEAAFSQVHELQNTLRQSQVDSMRLQDLLERERNRSRLLEDGFRRRWHDRDQADDLRHAEIQAQITDFKKRLEVAGGAQTESHALAERRERDYDLRESEIRQRLARAAQARQESEAKIREQAHLAQAETREALREQLDAVARAQTEIAHLRQAVAVAEARATLAEKQVKDLEGRIPTLQAQIEALDAERTRFAELRAEAHRRAEQLNGQLGQVLSTLRSQGATAQAQSQANERMRAQLATAQSEAKRLQSAAPLRALIAKKSEVRDAVALELRQMSATHPSRVDAVENYRQLGDGIADLEALLAEFNAVKLGPAAGTYATQASAAESLPNHLGAGIATL